MATFHSFRDQTFHDLRISYCCSNFIQTSSTEPITVHSWTDVQETVTMETSDPFLRFREVFIQLRVQNDDVLFRNFTPWRTIQPEQICRTVLPDILQHVFHEHSSILFRKLLFIRSIFICNVIHLVQKKSIW